MTELSFDTFQKNSTDADEGPGAGSHVNAREVIKQHNQNAASFYKKPISTTMTHETSSSSSSEDPGSITDIGSFYNDLVKRLSMLLEPNNPNEEDLSTIRGDMMSQVYYYGVTAVLLYLFYRILYKKRK